LTQKTEWLVGSQGENMARYVDGFVIPIPKTKVKAYAKLAKRAAKFWLKYGALEYYETVGDDLNIKGFVSFPKLAKIKKNETVIFSWIVYKSRAHRDRVNAKIMNDPVIKKMCDTDMKQFDMKRMSYGGFKVLVQA